MPVKPIPDGFHAITPHIVVRDSAKAIDFYKRAFGAVEVSRHTAPGGKIMNASLRIGDSCFMLNDEFPDLGGSRSPESAGGTTCTLHLYVSDVDALFKRAVDAGATVETPLTDSFWGDRYGLVIDPFGHRWSMATHINDVTAQEIERAGAAAMAAMANQA
jgi:PhnB protein